MRFIVLAALVVGSFAAHAQSLPTCGSPLQAPLPYDAVNWTWTNPDKNDDGSAVKWPMTITFYEGAGKLCQLVYPTPVTDGAASWSNLKPGVHAWVVTARTADGESQPSNIVQHYVIPQGYHVDPLDLHSYTVNTTDGAVTAIEVGTLPLGTQCDTSSIVRGYGFAQPMYHVSEEVARAGLYAGQTILVALAKCLPN